MNIVRFAGGLGNQMFQYALYKSLEFNGCAKVKANIFFYNENKEATKREFELLKVFPDITLHLDEENICEKRRQFYFKIYKSKWMKKVNYCFLSHNIYFSEKEDSVFDNRIYKLRHSAICGYWQTEKYFREIASVIRNDFRFNVENDKLEKLASMLKAHKNYVSVHIRRGDYVIGKYSQLYGNVCMEEYYKKAIDYMKQHVKKPEFVFFSDDISWAEEHFKEEKAIFVSSSLFENYEDWYDMYLMSCCAHNIIANSSFSWWGAWLNVNPFKIVIAPAKWLNGKETPDICPTGWIRI